MQRHNVASTLRRRCIDVMCPLGIFATNHRRRVLRRLICALFLIVRTYVCFACAKKKKKKKKKKKNPKNPRHRKHTFGHMCLAKIQISLHMRTVKSDFSLKTFLIVKDAKFLHADNKDSDQTARMRRLF